MGSGTPNRFVANMATLAAGTGAAQAITLLAVPVLARLYDPTEFGALATFSSTAALLGLAATARYEVAIPLPATEGTARDLFRLSLGLASLTAIATTVAVLAAGPSLAELLGATTLERWLPLLPLVLVILAAGQACTFWLARQRRFRWASSASVLDAAFGTTGKLALGSAGLGAGGLILGALAGQLAALAALGVGALRAGALSGASTLQGLRAAAREQRAYPAFELPNALSYAFGIRGMVLIASGLFGGTVVGLIAVAEQLMLAPINVLIAAYRQVVYPDLAEAHRAQPEQLGQRIGAATDQIGLWLAPPFMLALVAVPWVAPWLLGERWSGVSDYIFILSPPVLLTSVIAPCGYLLQIIGRQDLSLRLNLRLMVVRIGLLAVAGALFGLSAEVALWIASAGHFAVLVVNVRTTLQQGGVALPRSVRWLTAGAVLWYAGLWAMPAMQAAVR